MNIYFALKLTVTIEETMVYFSNQVTKLLNLKASTNVASYNFHWTIRPSILIIPGKQQFCFSSGFHLPNSHDRWFNMVATAFRGFYHMNPHFQCDICWQSCMESLSVRTALSWLAKESCFGCKSFILLNMIFLKSHGYSLCHF